MNEKSYVTLAVCPICKKETGTLLLDKRLKDRFEMHTITPEVCKKCEKKYLKEGVMLMNPETGALVVIKVEAFKRIFDKPVPPKHICFTEQAVLDYLNQQQAQAEA